MPEIGKDADTFDSWDDWYLINLPRLRDLAAKHGLSLDTVVLGYHLNLVKNAIHDVENLLEDRP